MVDLDARGRLGDPPRPLWLALVTFGLIAVLGFLAFAIGRSGEHPAYLIIALIGASGLSTAIGFALVVAHYRLLLQSDAAIAEVLAARAAFDLAEEETRNLLHDARSVSAALSATLHLMQVPDKAPEAASLLSGHLDSLQHVLEPIRGRVAPCALADLTDPLHRLADTHGIDLDLDFDPRARVLADPTATMRVLTNLVDNCRKYAPGSQVRISSERVGPYHLVSVEDEGPGVGIDVGLLFSPGARSRTDLQGYGMGLPSALSLAEAMGGALWYEAPDQGGARFVLRLRATDGDGDPQ